MAIPYVKEIDVEYGRVDQVSPLVRRVIANNPGDFTYTGTGVYIIVRGTVAVIDPGPMQDDHFDALKAAHFNQNKSEFESFMDEIGLIDKRA